ncbi:GNAT family N-acetyltransferase [Zhihengliuella halotolerans]|uniref:GNAT family N-acetyltransferase n=1 Tax=Zhihengliuella halotolerans TaxID=370736 RepID=UPI000C7FBB04|nr:GNAT family N-acetyltransferase [Zhihengliuella halotolerans]
MPLTIRPYTPADEPSWLRCRVLSFLDSCYYDDVWTSRPSSPAIQLVAVEAGQVLGILDVELEDGLATIDTIAVHPDHQGRGIASMLLNEAMDLLPSSVTALDAWTREDEPALRWYASHGFVESEHYLHVYKSWEDSGDGWMAPAPLSVPVSAFSHAAMSDEADLRERFDRVYVCRRFSKPLTPS